MALSLDGTTGIDVTGVLTTTGNVGIGTSSPRSAGGYTSLGLNNATTGAFIDFSTAGTRQATITGTTALFDFQSALTSPITFSTNGAIERMRINSNGKVSINGAPEYYSLNLLAPAGSHAMSIKVPTAGYHGINFWNGSGTLVGSIAVNASSTAYNTSSDYRLKEDWQPMSGSVDRVKALKPVNFAWKADGSRVDGFLAHEAQAVVPEAITGKKDAVTAYGNITDTEGTVVQESVVEPETLEEGQMWTKVEDKPDYQGIDQSKLVPLLTAALQDSIAKIEALEARVTALENA